MNSSEYINQQQYTYSLYVLQSRAIPASTDGLKAAARRVLWIARNGNKYKSATLAGLCMDIHPHAAPESTVNTLSAYYGNNVPLLTGTGAFGTLLNPQTYGASRYTSVKLSEFAKKVMFADIEIIPMMDNYDNTTKEPKHFLPIVPIALINPIEGIAVGFATNILPRKLSDIIKIQIKHLQGESCSNKLIPYFAPINDLAMPKDNDGKDNVFYFSGTIERKNSSMLKITKLPYKYYHSKAIAKLEDLYEQGVILDIIDNSKDTIDIELKFKRGFLSTIDDEKLHALLGLRVRCTENLNVIDLSSSFVWHPKPIDLIKEFTDWRLSWYPKRYERLRKMVEDELVLYNDIKKAITNKLGKYLSDIGSKEEMLLLIDSLQIVNREYIANLPIYRFTEEERIKNQKKIDGCEKLLSEYVKILSSDNLRRKIYIHELESISDKY